MAAVNAAVRDRVRRAGADPLAIDLAAPNLDRSVGSRLGRLPRVLGGLVRLASTCGLRGGKMYMSVSGGLGQAYEILFLLIARVRGMRVFLHHHSFAYLDVPNRLTRWLMRAAGVEAVHVTLSRNMSEKLKTTYGTSEPVALSNAVFFLAQEMMPRVRDKLGTVGFLGNISAEKGVFDFLEVCELSEKKGVSVRAVLGGPFQDKETERRVRERASVLRNVEYVGPKYGSAKEAFYANIDVLLFPTHYINEAEPVTVHEAMRNAVPVIAYGRGCIPEIVGPDCGIVIDTAKPFAEPALNQIERWINNPAVFATVSRAAAQRFRETYNVSQRRWQQVLKAIASRSTEV